MYPIVILAHSWIRWLVLLFALAALVRAVIGMRGRKIWASTDDRAISLFASALDLQMVLGALIFVSLGSAAGSRRIIEHAGGMLVALVLAHIGHRRIRRLPAGDSRRHRLALIFVGASLALILLAIPWTAPMFRP